MSFDSGLNFPPIHTPSFPPRLPSMQPRTIRGEIGGFNAKRMQWHLLLRMCFSSHPKLRPIIINLMHLIRKDKAPPFVVRSTLRLWIPPNVLQHYTQQANEFTHRRMIRMRVPCHMNDPRSCRCCLSYVAQFPCSHCGEPGQVCSGCWDYGECPRCVDKHEAHGPLLD